ncbi:MAG: putative Ig domain-containing protein [Opitutae bacterium]|nr:putative Ig domain-containing protein [Opitutae bacterium]
MPPAPVPAAFAAHVFGARGPVTIDDVPAGRFRDQLLALSPTARERALAALGRLHIPRNDVVALGTDREGALYYECERPTSAAEPASAASTPASPTVSAASVPVSAPPVRHSRPGASRVLYLDFNGHTVTGTAWNDATGSRPAVASYVCRPYDTDGDETKFNDTEQAAIADVWQRVAEDYSPFDVDVTTEEPASFTAQTLRALVTRTTDANGVANPSATTSAGVAYLDVFGRVDLARHLPVFVYFDVLSGTASIADVVSHELGHNLALSHDGTSASSYYRGHGTGSLSWGPIMGAPYSRSVTQWSKGDYYDANNPQDDLAIIAGRLAFRTDVVGASLAAAVNAPTTGNDVSATDVLLGAGESHFHRVVTSAGRITFSVSPVAYGNSDLRLELLDSAGNAVALDDSAAERSAMVLTANPVAAGVYYLKVTAAGTGTPLANPPSGYAAYGSVGQYTLAGSVVAAPPVVLSATAASVGVGNLFSYQTQVAGFADSYGATGLPPGLAIDGTTGAITGRPTALGVFSITLSATNSVGTGQATLALTVTDAAPVVTAASTPSVVLTPGGSATLSVTGFSVNGAIGYQWFRNGRAIAGATSATYNVANATERGLAAYWVVLTNTIGTTRSAPFFVNMAPAITRIRTWGVDNSYGQSTVPAGLGRMVAVAAGSSHSAAVAADGSIVSWGSTKVVPAVNDAVAIAAGYDFTAALRRDGTVTVAGSGNVSANILSVPANLRDVVAIGAGSYHVLALKSDGTVATWGSPNSNVLSPPAGLRDVVAIAAGGSYSLALKADGTVVGWGSTTASPPPALAGVRFIATGNGASLALKTGGAIVAWGANGFAAPPLLDERSLLALGGLGAFAAGEDGRLTAWNTSGTGATPPSDLGPVRGIAVSSYHAVALCEATADAVPTIVANPQSAAGGIGAPLTLRVSATGPGVFSYQWRKGGAPIAGATSSALVFDSLQPADAGTYDVVVGNHVGTVTSTAATLTIEAPPLVTSAPSSITEIAVGAPLVLAADVTTANGPLAYQWFRNNRPIPGATSPTYSRAAFTAADAGAYVLESTDAHGVTARTLTFVRPARGSTQVEVWGYDSGGLKNVPSNLGDAVEVKSTFALAIAVRANGALALWGGNASVGARAYAAGIADAVAAASTNDGFVVLRSNGRIVTWRSTTGATTEPLRDAIAIAANENFIAALLADGTVRTWSGNAAPAVPAELSGVTAIVAGSQHLLALKLDGAVVAMGSNSYGQSSVPAGLGGVVAIAGGNGHSVALKSDGTVVGWGSGSGGTPPSDLSTATALAAGWDYSFALRADGTLAIWGTSSAEYFKLPSNLADIFAIHGGRSTPMLIRRAAADSAPAIVQQPAAVVTAVGESVRFDVRATGAAPLTYAWRKNGVAIGGNSPALDLLNVQAGDAGTYDVVVSSHRGAVTSMPVALEIVTPPAITLAPPQRVLAQPGEYVRFGVSATSANGPLAYQWKKNNRPIAGATTPNLTLRQAAPSDAGAYTVEITDVRGAISRATTFLVLDPGRTQVRTDYGYISDVPPTLGDAIAVRTGGNSAAYALRRDGAAVGWGTSFSGVLPTSTLPFVDLQPIDSFGFALKADGKVVAWGSPIYSNIGTVPAALDGVIAISARSTSTAYALRSDGRVYSWDYHGAFAVVPVPTLPVTAIAASSTHLLMLQIDGTVVATGDNYDGACDVPAGLTGVVAIAAGNGFSLALKADGTVVHWGYNWSNENTPPAWLTEVVALDARERRSYALRADGSVVGWGSGGAGTLSNLSPALSVAAPGYSSGVVVLRRAVGDALPTITEQPTGPAALTAGDTVTLRVAASGPGRLGYQWRKDGTPIPGATAASFSLSPVELGDAGSYDVVVANHMGSTTSDAVRFDVLAPPALTGTPVRRYFATSGSSITLGFSATSAHGPLTYQWKRNNRPIAGATAASYELPSVARADGGAYTLEISDTRGVVTRATAFVLVAGATAVRAWGANDSGQTDVPAGLDDVVSVAAGNAGNLALRADGSVVAWGKYYAYGGQVISVPADVGEVAAVALSGDLAAVLRSDGSVRLWSGGYASLPVPASVRNAISIGLGYGQACALLADGRVVTWSVSSGAVVDTGAVASSGVVAIARGSEHLLTLRADGTVRGWAANGNSYPVNAATVPVDLSGVVAIGAGGNQSVALKSDGSIVAWGENSSAGSFGPGVATAIGSGASASAAVRPNGQLLVWASSGSSIAAVPADLGTVVGFALGSSHGVAIVDRSSLPLPTITQQPASLTVAPGDTAIFRVVATGLNPVRYQWRKNGAAISGATAAALVLPAVQDADAATYDVVVSNPAGSVTSQGATVTLATGPRIAAAPTPRVVSAVGAPVTLTVAADSAFGPLSYRWKKNNRPIAGATSATLSLPGFAADQAGAYTVEVTDNRGVVSRATSFVLAARSHTQVLAFGDVPANLATPPDNAGNNLLAFASGSSHLVALRADGSVVAWGSNDSSQTSVPDGLANVVAVAAGGASSMALKADGTVATWGRGYAAVETVPGLDGVIAIAAADYYHLALRADGTVVTWTRSEINDPTVTPPPTPPAVVAGWSDVVAIGANSGVAAAVKLDGTVVVSGPGSDSRVTGAASQSSLKKVVLNSSAALGLRMDDSIVGWGYGSYTLPVPSSVGAARDVGLGYYHGIALKGNGSIVGWGHSTYAQAPGMADVTNAFAIAVFDFRTFVLREGPDDTAPTIATPPVDALVATGRDAVFSVVASGSGPFRYQWRRDGTPIAGATAASLIVPAATAVDIARYDVVVSNHVGSTTSAAAMLTVATPPSFASAPTPRQVVVAGQPLTLTFALNGSANDVTFRWSLNNRPIAGANGASYTIPAVNEQTAGAYTLTVADALGFTVRRTVFVLLDCGPTRVRAWGSSGSGQLAVPASLGDALALSAGGSHGLALRRDGTVAAWGGTNNGAAVVPANLSEVVAVAAGATHSVALRSDGTVLSWGNGGTVPIGLRDVIAIAAGDSRSIALTSDGTVAIWASGFGSLTPPANLSDVTAVAAGSSQFLALRTDGKVTAWNAGSVSYAETAAADALRDVIAISAGGATSGALGADGRVTVWGSGSSALAIGNTEAVALACGTNFGLLRLRGGGFLSWGETASGARNIPADLGVVHAFSAGGNFALALCSAASDTAPVVTAQPQSAIAAPGGRVTFTAAATGSGSLAYQWRRDGTAIAGATSPTLLVAPIAASSGGTYELVVTNHVGSVVSAPAVLTIAPAPVFTTRPPTRLAPMLGQPVTLTGAATTATGPITYRWKKNNRPIAGATSATFTLPEFSNADAGAYTLEAVDANGLTGRATTFLLPDYGPSEVVHWGNTGNIGPVPASLGNVIAVLSGNYYEAALRRDGTVTVWTAGSGSIRNVPAGLSDVVALAGGAEHILALRADGTVVAWGYGYYGQVTVPAGLSDVIAIATGDNNAVALKSDGTVTVWGDATHAVARVPAEAADLCAIAVSGHALALRADGTVVAWGNNSSGQATVPAGLNGVTAVAAGGYHSLALRADGTLLNWGAVTPELAIPVGLGVVRAFAASGYSAGAIKADGAVVMWGSDSYGMNSVPSGVGGFFALAIGSGYHAVAARSAVADALPVIAAQPQSSPVARGGAHTLSVTATSTRPLSYQWRRNGAAIAGATAAELELTAISDNAGGDYDVLVSNPAGTVPSAVATLTVATPPAVVVAPPARSVVAPGAPLTLSVSATSADGPLAYQWRRNNRVLAGATAATLSLPAFTVSDAGAYTVEIFDSHGVMTRVTSFVLADPGRTQLRAWGESAETVETPTQIDDAVAVSAGFYHSLALRAGGTVLAWGRFTVDAYAVPADLREVVAIAAGDGFSLALRQDGTVRGWRNSYASSAPTVTVPPLTNVIAIAAGETAVALCSDGKVVSWDPRAASTVIAVPASAKGAVAVCAGGSQAMALRADGTVVAWSTSSGSATVPDGLTNVTQIAAGENVLAAIKADGSLIAWGYYRTGAPAAARAVSCADSYAIAQSPDGTLRSWGSTGSYGETTVPADLGAAIGFGAGRDHVVALRDANADAVPTLSSEPQPATRAPGASQTFSVAAAGAGPLSYQWFKDGVAISGATSASFTLGALTDADAGDYSVIVSNHVGARRSVAATLTVLSPPAVSSRPALRTTATLGQPLSLAVAATSANGALSYQWKKSNRPIAGATSATLDFDSFTFADAGAYTLEVTDGLGLVNRITTFVMPANVATQVRAWGNNSSGQSDVPPTLNDAVKVSAVDSLSFALRANGEVVAWGATGNVSLAVSGLTDIVDIAGAIVLRSDRRVVNLGRYGYAVPAAATDVVGIAAGASHSLALRADGTVVAWGSNSYGQCSVPPGLGHVMAIAASAESSSALLLDGSVVVWGNLRGLAPPAGMSFVDLAMGSQHLLARKADGTVVAWSSYSYAAEASVPAGATNAVRIAAAPGLSLAIKPDGTLAAWGSSGAPTGVPAGLDNVWSMAASSNHALALRNGANDAAPAIATQPAAQNVGVGMRATFSVDATGTAPIAYQWRRNGIPISGATAASLTIAQATANDAGTYDVVVTNHRGSVTSAAVALTVDVPPQITGGSDQRLTIAPGQPLALTVAATTANGPLSYRWKKNNRVIAGATAATYSLANFAPADAGAYTVEISDALGRTSRRTSFVLPAFGATQLIGFGDGGGSSALKTLPSTIAGPLVSVATGSSFNVVLRLDGTVAAWGYNGSGQTNVPAGLSGVVAIAAYGSYALALKSDGTVVMWGNSGNATLVPPSGVTDVIAIAAGGSHALALKSDGTVVAWGYTGYGATAVPVGLSDVVSIAAFENFSLAVKADGTVAGWGATSYSQVSAASAQSGMARLSPNYYCVVGVKTDGSVTGWGTNNNGQLTIPANLGAVTDVSAIGYHVLALRADGSLAAWGYSSYGETTVPANATGCFAIATATYRSLALRNASADLAPTISQSPQSAAIAEGGAVNFSVSASGTGPLSYQWRKDGVAISGATSASLALGAVTVAQGGAYDVVVTNHVGAVTSAAATLTVNALPTITAQSTRRNVAAPGGAASFSVTASGTGALSYRWSHNGRPIVGATSATLAVDSVTPADAGWYVCTITDANGPRRAPAQWLSVAPARTQVIAWAGRTGGYDYGQTKVPAGLNDAVAISAGAAASAVVRRDGTLTTWGYPSYLPSASATIAGVVDVAATGSSVVTLHDDGSVRSWGNYTTVPSGITDAVALSAGDSIAAVLRADGAVTYWSIYSSSGTTVADLGAVAIAVSNGGSLALKADGTVVSFGATVSIPGNLTNVTAIAAGSSHWLALHSDGTVTAWGGDSAGQATVPDNLTNVVAVSASANSSFALKSDGSVVAWGSNTYGETAVPVGFSTLRAVANNSNGWHLLALRDVSADAPPTIATGPADTIAAVSDRVVFSVTASGVGPFSYQWRKDGVPIPGAIAASLIFDAVSAGAAGAYDVVVSNHVGSVASTAATLAVESGLNFTQRPPERLAGTPGAAVTLTATVDASYLPLSYQWQKENRPIAGATEATYSIANFSNADAGAYTLVATDAHGHRAYATTFVQPAYGPTQVRVWGYIAGTAPAALLDIVDGAAGVYNQAVVRANGSVAAWGNNLSNTNVGVTDVVRVAVGSTHLLAVRSNGLVVGAGSTSSGQIAIPASLRDVIAVAAGDSHSLALRADGTVMAWGSNSANQAAVPAGLAGVVAIAACGATSAALTLDGAIVVWGDTSAGQASVPVGLGRVAKLALGRSHVLALRADGTVAAWGSNSSGQCTIPAGLDNVVEIAASESTSFARKADGTLVVWGQNYYGQATVPAGLGTVYRLMAGGNSVMVLRSTADDTGPAITSQPASVAATLGNSYSFAVAADGPTPLSYQWRKNGAAISGQTSATLWLYYVDASTAGSYDVVVSNHVGSVTSAAATLTIATTGGPTLSASGASRLQPALGQPVTLAFDASGAGTLSFQWKKDGRPIAGATAPTLSLPSFTNVEAGAYTLEVSDSANRTSRATIFVLPNYGATRLRGWGLGAWGQTTPPASLSNPIGIGAGDGHSLALLRDGRVIAWGANTFGQTAVPDGLSSVVAIAAGGFHNLALNADGSVVAWGANGSSQSNVPSSAKSVIAIAAGYTQSVALRDDGSVISWGSNSYSPPAAPSGVAVAAGGAHALVLKSNGTVLAWGDNTYGQTTVPAGLENVVAIAAGTSHSAALKSDGTVVAWGRNQLGQTSVPAALGGVVALRACVDYCIAVKADGTVVTWGDTSGGIGGAPADLGPTLDVAAGSRHGLALIAGAPVAGPSIAAHPQSENVREGATITLRVTATGTGSLAYEWRRDGVALTDNANRSGSATDALRLSGFNASAAGNYTVVVTDANGSTASLTAVVAYEKTPQNITFTALPDCDYSASPVALAATASSGLPVAFELVSGPAQLSGGTLSLSGAGQVTIRALQSGNAVYAAATAVERAFTVGKVGAVVSLGNLAAVFDGTPKPATATTNPGGLGVVITYNGWSPAPIGAGTYAVSATVTDARFAGAIAGTLTIEKASQTIAFAAPGDRPFATAPLALGASASSGLGVVFTVISGPAAIAGDSLTLLGSGAIKVRASQAGDENYLAAPNVDRTFVVGTTFDAWRLAYFTADELLDATISGPNADPDHDGFANLVEYALGSDPRANSTANAPAMSTAAGNWTFTYTRPADRPDIVYTVEYSTNLTTWNAAGVTHTLVSSANGVETWRATYPTSSTPSCFFRLVVTR